MRYKSTMPEITKDRILAYAEFYKFDNENDLKLEESILKKTQTVENSEDLFKLILDKENGILKWKGALRIKRYFEDIEYWKSIRKTEFLSEIKKSCDNRDVNKEIVQQLVKYRGISYPIASTVVYFFSQGNCPIIDWRAIQTLKEINYNVKNDDWDGYFKICIKIVDNYGISLRDLDKALWIYQDVKKHIKVCGKLADLNII